MKLRLHLREITAEALYTGSVERERKGTHVNTAGQSNRAPGLICSVSIDHQVDRNPALCPARETEGNQTETGPDLMGDYGLVREAHFIKEKEEGGLDRITKK